MTQQLLIDDAGRDNPDGRNEHDFYETPAFQTRALLARVPIAGRVLEPCAGMGAICNVLLNRPGIRAVYMNEPFQPLGPCPMRLDATQPSSWARFPVVDWVITNPTFELASRIVPLAFEHARVGIAFLLRITWYEATKDRAEWLDAHPPDAIISLPRYKYRKDKGKHGDSATTAWFVWLKQGAGIVVRNSVRNSVVTRAECKRLKVAE